MLFFKKIKVQPKTLHEKNPNHRGATSNCIQVQSWFFFKIAKDYLRNSQADMLFCAGGRFFFPFKHVFDFFLVVVFCFFPGLF